MPYTMDSLPEAVKELPEKDQKQWLEVFNSAFESCMEDDGEKDKCEESAFKQSWGIVKKNARSRMEDFVARMTKMVESLFSWSGLQDRAASIDSIFYQVCEAIEGDDPNSYVNNLYFEEDGNLFAVISKDGKLYRATIRYESGVVTVEDMIEVMLDFPQRQRVQTTIMRQADGCFRWFSISGSAALLRVGEIDSRELFDSFILHAEETGEYPIRVFHHLGDQFRTGQVDFIGRDENLLITSGLYDDTEIARMEVEARLKEPEYWGISIGYVPTSKPEMLKVMDGVSIPVWRSGILTEESTLPETSAAAWFTATPTIKEVKRMLGDKQFEAFVKLFNGDEAAAKQWLDKNAETRNRAILDAGMITRESEPAIAPATEPVGEPETVATEPEAVSTELVQAQAQVVLDDIVLDAVSRSALAAMLSSEPMQGLTAGLEQVRTAQETLTKAIADQAALISMQNDRLLALEQADQAARQRYNDDLPAAMSGQVSVTYRPRNAAADVVTPVVAQNSDDLAAQVLERIPAPKY